MAEKSRPFSIYLLREGYNATNTLIDDHNLITAENAEHVPEGATLYILDAQRKRPWWRSYFGVEEDIWQEFKGALLFLPAGGRHFALSFGQVHHNIKDAAYEYDFGLRVTLNMLDPNELRSADMVEPGPARRKRTQVPVSTELTYLDFDANSEIIKSLTGKVKPEYAELFKSASGASSLKVSLKLDPDELAERCEHLLGLYESEEYKIAFPNIENITPVRHPDDIAPLDEALLAAVRAASADATLTIPDIVDYRDHTCCMFAGGDGTSQIYPDISIEKFYEYLGDDLPHVQIEDLKKTYRILLTDTDGVPDGSYSLYRSMIFDVEPAAGDTVYHLCEGAWYKVERAFATRLRDYLDAKCEVTDLAAYNHDVINKGKLVYSEEAYNEAMAVAFPDLLCLDQEDISPAGSTSIEPCDLYATRPDGSAASGHRATFYHIKISTRSSHLSHLFNQGVNSVELISLEPASQHKMRALIATKLAGADPANYHAPLDNRDFRVVFGIITHKTAAALSANLPLFSKLSLMRNMQRLDLMRIPSAVTFIPDQSAAKGGHTKYQRYLVEVYEAGGRHVVRARPDQGLDINQLIKRCPKDVSDSAPGSRFNLSIKVNEDGTYSSSHHWPYQAVA